MGGTGRPTPSYSKPSLNVLECDTLSFCVACGQRKSAMSADTFWFLGPHAVLSSQSLTNPSSRPGFFLLSSLHTELNSPSRHSVSSKPSVLRLFCNRRAEFGRAECVVGSNPAASLLFVSVFLGQVALILLPRAPACQANGGVAV